MCSIFKSFIVLLLSFDLKSSWNSYFEWCEVGVKIHFSLYGYPGNPATLMEDIILSPMHSSVLFVCVYVWL